jgi:lysozyme
MKIPTWLYWPMKAMLLAGFCLPFVLWGVQWNSVARDAEMALASPVENGINKVEKPSVDAVTQPKPAPIDNGNPAHVMGIDVAHYQQRVNWDQAAKAGVAFAFAKATEGNSYVDPSFAEHWRGMREANLYRGAYHFFLADDDPMAQAKHFTDTLGTLRRMDLPPVLDMEHSDHVDDKTVQERALVWLQEVEKITGRRPILYTFPGFADTVITDPRFSRYPLWIADYVKIEERRRVRVPSPWETQGWQFWQHDDKGSIAGVEGNVDINRFNGSLHELIDFIEKSHVE